MWHDQLGHGLEPRPQARGHRLCAAGGIGFSVRCALPGRSDVPAAEQGQPAPGRLEQRAGLLDPVRGRPALATSTDRQPAGARRGPAGRAARCPVPGLTAAPPLARRCPLRVHRRDPPSWFAGHRPCQCAHRARHPGRSLPGQVPQPAGSAIGDAVGPHPQRQRCGGGHPQPAQLAPLSRGAGHQGRKLRHHGRLPRCPWASGLGVFSV